MSNVQTGKQGIPYRYVVCDTSRHGKVRYYLRMPGRGKVRLPDYVNREAFAAAYHAALNGIDWRTDYRLMSLDNLVRQAAKRAVVYGREFDLDFDWAVQAATAQADRCAVTGLPFDFTAHVEHQATHHNPSAPSIDRVDSRGGYTRDNSRLVLFSVNVAMSDWGMGEFLRIAKAALEHQGRRAVPSSAEFEAARVLMSALEKSGYQLTERAPDTLSSPVHSEEPRA